MMPHCLHVLILSAPRQKAPSHNHRVGSDIYLDLCHYPEGCKYTDCHSVYKSIVRPPGLKDGLVVYVMQLGQGLFQVGYALL